MSERENWVPYDYVKAYVSGDCGEKDHSFSVSWWGSCIDLEDDVERLKSFKAFCGVRQYDSMRHAPLMWKNLSQKLLYSYVDSGNIDQINGLSSFFHPALRGEAIRIMSENSASVEDVETFTEMAIRRGDLEELKGLSNLLLRMGNLIEAKIGSLS